MNQSIVKLQGISKRFNGVKALNDISFEIRPGTVHSLVGENGAGKSTLGKIIAGVHSPDTGKFFMEGREVVFSSPKDALTQGIAMISQEVSLIPKRTVIENVFLGIESTRLGIVQKREMYKKYQEITERTGIFMEPNILVSSLRIADQKKVEVLRAVARNARLIVMDEPTAALSSNETKMLYALIEGLKKIGTTIVYVSHFLEEVLMLSDTVSVLRNGDLIKTSLAENETPESLVEAMLGGFVSVGFPEKKYVEYNAPIVLSVKDLSREGFFEDISFEIKAGEIVGLAGLAGSGRSEICRAIFGADQPTKGVIKLLDEEKKINSPYEAVKAGIALLPESRKLEGLIMNFSSAYNITLPHLLEISLGPFVREREEKERTNELLRKLDLRALNPKVNVGGLSGGNQQKVLFAKCLFKQPHLFMADEPTAGVDIGAKQEIYKLIHKLASEGMAVLLVSSDLKEILGLAHRVLVICKGRMDVELKDTDLKEDKVMHAIFDTDKDGEDIC